MKHPHFIEFWYKPSYAYCLDSDDGVVTISEESYEEVGRPIKLAQVNGSLSLYNSLATFAPDASFFAVFDGLALKVFLISVHSLLTLRPKRKRSSTNPIVKFWDSVEDWNKLVQKYQRNKSKVDLMDMDENENSGENTSDDVGTNTLVVTSLLATNEHLYFAEGDFTIWRLNVRSKERSDNIVQLAKRSILF